MKFLFCISIFNLSWTFKEQILQCICIFLKNIFQGLELKVRRILKSIFPVKWQPCLSETHSPMMREVLPALHPIRLERLQSPLS